MKKLIILITLSALTLSAVAGEKSQANSCKKRVCEIKEAASCCSPNGSCATEKDCKGKKETCEQIKKADCPACKASGKTCAACKAKKQLDTKKPTKQSCGSGGCSLFK